MSRYERALHFDLNVLPFVENILGISDEKEKDQAITRIVEAERNLRGANYSSTLYDHTIRNYRYVEERRRNQLCERILQELVTQKRLSNDDDIKLGKGGAAPLTTPQHNKEVFYVIGPPASGKSGIASILADAFGAYILDSDYAKRKLPEYNQQGGASLVHEESDAIIFSRAQGNLLQHCISEGLNMVIPKIGQNADNIKSFCSRLKKFGYKVYLISVDLDRAKATQRAYARYIQTKRYIPLSLIFDGYGNDPTLNYFKLKQRNNRIFSGYAQISTDVKRGDPPILLEVFRVPGITSIFSSVRGHTKTAGI